MASRSVNKVTLIGNLTRDPELKYTPQGTAVCSFGVATNRSWTTATGEVKEDVQFHRIVAWQKLAELCKQLLTKGRKVYLEGRIVYRTFTGKDGVQRTATEIIMDDFVLFDDRRRVEQAAEEPVTTPQPSTGDLEVLEGDGEEKTAEKKKTSKKTQAQDIKKEVGDEKMKEARTRDESDVSAGTDKPADDEEVDPDDIPF